MQQFTFANQITPYLNSLYGRKVFSQVQRYNMLLKEFKHRYGYSWAYFCSSSGRVEFVGNHLDHNGGNVIGCTVDLDIVMAFRPNGTNVINVEGIGRSPVKVDISNLSKTTPSSAGLVKGVVSYLLQHGYAVGGFDAYSHSTVPSGAGVSSSAAFETAIGCIISACFNNNSIPPEVLAKAGQYAENEYFDKPCGLLDQSVVAVGGLVALDFASDLRYTSLQAQFNKLQLVLIDTGTSHANLSPLYAAIPAEMKAVANFFGKTRLIEVDECQFFERYDEVAQAVGQRAALRAKHFYEENRRVYQMEQALSVGDVQTVMQLINQSGDSSLYQLQNCAVDDQDTVIADVIATARSICNCGARVHGGGFAGTVLCVLPCEEAKEFVAEMQRHYGDDHVLPLRIRSVGAQVL